MIDNNLTIDLDQSKLGRKKQYKKLCFKDIIYEVGDMLSLKETENSNVVGKLVRIISEGGNPAHPKWPMIEV